MHYIVLQALSYSLSTTSLIGPYPMRSSYDEFDNVLLLDDDFDNVAFFMLALERQDFPVVGFTEPLLALEHFQKNSDKFGLVISDIRMPVMNGYQFIGCHGRSL